MDEFVNDDPSLWASQIESLKGSARSENLKSWFLLLLVVVVLAVGANSFDKAGELAREEVSSVERLAKLADQLVGRVEATGKSMEESTKRVLDSRYAQECSANPGACLPGFNSMAFAEFRRSHDSASLILSSVESQLKGEFSEDMRRAVATISEATESGAKTAVIVQASVTRAGIVALMVFLVQVLLRFYRRASRAALELEARAESLRFFQGNRTKFKLKEVLSILSVDSLEEAGAKEAPTDIKQIVELLSVLRPAKSDPNG